MNATGCGAYRLVLVTTWYDILDIPVLACLAPIFPLLLNKACRCKQVTAVRQCVVVIFMVISWETAVNILGANMCDMRRGEDTLRGQSLGWLLVTGADYLCICPPPSRHLVLVLACSCRMILELETNIRSFHTWERRAFSFVGEGLLTLWQLRIYVLKHSL